MTTEVREYFTHMGEEDGLVHFGMEGKVKQYADNMPQINSYGGSFAFEMETFAIHQAKVEIAFTGHNYRKKLKYTLQALSAKDMEYL
jgi:hypothetical protein